MHPVDLVIIVAYLLTMPALGVLLGRRQRSASDYFVGERSLPWPAVCLSVVATETSTLTVISTPGLVWGGGFTFLQLALGYIVGRTIAAVLLLPRYFSGDLVTAYAYLGQRFGSVLQGTASVAFVVTRLLAEGVRLFAGAIPIKAILDGFGVHAAYWQIVVGLTALTVVYAYVGGIRSVVWVDVIQLSLYLGGAVVAAVVLLGKLPADWAHTAAGAGRFRFVDLASHLLTNPYTLVTGVIGGAVFSMASHGADQLIVQRLLACRSLRDGRRALIGSGILVFVQFGLFLLVGAMLWVFYGGASPKAMGLSSTDDVFPRFIVGQLPVGVAGLLIAGVLASTMGALASALNALSSSTVTDLYQRFTRRALPDRHVLRYGRLWTLVWAAVFVGFASLFSSTRDPVIVLGLGITGYTYGALLGSFLLGLFVARASQVDALIAFLATVAVMAVVILGVRLPGPNGASAALAFPWYPALGALVSLVVGGALALRHRGTPSPVETPAKAETAA
ncbi:sodium:solute symporter [Gandjariella thermophila]|uniref:Sodium:solute symporter n=1 Tax=Gandjariella thermophila TaxID=1931992 RepID=A0A4D4J7Z1_9PSEU|nr:sodium:solute symporter [Gandjariella thermophila]GDY30636.1 sodium:solute symporter [Gandjariella thermophila]